MSVIFMLYRYLLSPVSSDKLEGSYVMYSVVDKLFVGCFNGASVSYNGPCVAISVSGPFYFCLV